MREKFCMRCGTPLNGAAQCPACGYEPQHDACEVPGGPVPEGQSAAQPAAEPTPAAPREATAGTAAPGEGAPQAPQPVPPYAVPGAYAQPYAPWEPQPEPLTLGRTVGTLLVGALPLVGWIVLLIWAFESGAEPNRRTLARGYLVVKAIGWALAVLMYVLLFVFAFSMAGAMV